MHHYNEERKTENINQCAKNLGVVPMSRNRVATFNG